MFWKSLIGALTIGCSTTLPVVPTVMAISTHSIQNFEKFYDISFDEISSIDLNCYIDTLNIITINSKDVKVASGLPDFFYDNQGNACLYIKKLKILDQIVNVYHVSKDATREIIIDSMLKNPIINVSMELKQSIHSNTLVIQSFSAILKPKLPKSNILLLNVITDFSGKYSYSQIVENLNYLMVKRQDFDKFDYNYLYWVPIFNFLYDTKIDRRTTILVQWLHFKNIKLE